MKQKLLLVLTLIAFSANSQTSPIFNSGMSIVSEGATSSPFNEEVWQIIDGDAFTKFLDFDYMDGMEFTVNLGGTPAIATSIEITTANDAEGRDPMNYEIFGSNDGSVFTSVVTGNIPCDFNRYFARSFSFANTTSYNYYRIRFTNQCSSENSIQIAEVQLFQTVMGVEDLISESKEVVLYPNPSQGSFFIKQNISGSIDRVEIVNAVGAKVKALTFEKGMSQIVVNTENMSKGVYFARIHSGDKSVVKKLILK